MLDMSHVSIPIWYGLNIPSQFGKPLKSIVSIPIWYGLNY